MGGGLIRDIPEESGMKDLKYGWVVINVNGKRGNSHMTQALILEISHI